MKKIIGILLSVLLVPLFVSFLLYLVRPFFPGLSDALRKLSENLSNLINLDVNPQVISIVITLILFIVLVFLARMFRKSRAHLWDEVDPTKRYTSTPFTVAKLILIIIFIPLISSGDVSILTRI